MRKGCGTKGGCGTRGGMHEKLQACQMHSPVLPSASCLLTGKLGATSISKLKMAPAFSLACLAKTCRHVSPLHSASQRIRETPWAQHITPHMHHTITHHTSKYSTPRYSTLRCSTPRHTSHTPHTLIPCIDGRQENAGLFNEHLDTTQMTQMHGNVKGCQQEMILTN